MEVKLIGVDTSKAVFTAAWCECGGLRGGALRHQAGWAGGVLLLAAADTGGAGDERLRQLLVVGATAVIRHVRPGKAGASACLLGLLERRPCKLPAVALANKMARVVWAMMARGEAYRPVPAKA